MSRKITRSSEKSLGAPVQCSQAQVCYINLSSDERRADL